jgi:two-component system, LytTR family, sensor kinase
MSFCPIRAIFKNQKILLKPMNNIYFSEENKHKLRNLSIHVTVWLMYLFYNNLLLFLDGSMEGFLYRTVFNYSLLVCVFYINAHLILDKFIPSKKYFSIVVFTLLLIIAYILGRYFLQFYIFPFLNIKSSYKMMSNQFYVDGIWLGVNYIIYSYGYWYIRHTIRLEREKAQADREKAEAEIAFLQTQINPHFMYNTLNFMYSQAIMVSDPLAESIMALSDIMRYTIMEAGKKGTVSLEKEIEHIENYIKLQQFRFNNKLIIDFNIEGEEYIPTMEMLPLVLISFVENAFKHGDLTDPEMPLIIHITITENTFNFLIKNKKSFGSKERSSGIGMPNIIKRLQLIYPEKHSLIITDNHLDYATELKIFDII